MAYIKIRKEQMFCFSVDKDRWSNYNDTYNNKKTRPQTVLAHLGRVSYMIFVMAEATLYYCIFLSFMSSVSAIIPIFNTGCIDQYSYYRKVIGLLSAP